MKVKQIEKKIIITFRWWNNEEGIESHHTNILEDIAMERIGEMISEGYTAGDLESTMGEVEYSGWWEISIVTA